MKRSWKIGLGAGLLAPALALGCQSTRSHGPAGGCATCGGGAVASRDVQNLAPNSTPAPAYAVAQAPPAAPQVNHEMAAPPAPAPRSLAFPQRVAAQPPLRIAEPANAPAAFGAGYHHSPDYTTLVGELHYNPRHNTWRLRYAGVDQEDRYGGSVTLTNVGREMKDFKSGQYVRVDGALLDAASRDVSPAYQVRDILPAGPR